MFYEYEDTLIDFLSSLSCSNPDDFTDHDWQLIKFYTKSDGCTGVADAYVKACWEHDFYFRTRHDFAGKIISFRESNRRFRLRIQRLSHFGVCSPMAWWRWAGVTAFGRQAWVSRKTCGF